MKSTTNEIGGRGKTAGGKQSEIIDDEIIVGIQQIVALIGDRHTYLQLPKSFQRYPISFRRADWRQAEQLRGMASNLSAEFRADRALLGRVLHVSG
jgi:hypothetical protein